MLKLKQNLRLLMKTRKVSRKEVAATLGVSEATIGKYVRGERMPSIESVVKIAEMFDVTVDWLLTGKDSRAGLAPRETHRYMLTVAGDVILQEVSND